MMPITQLCRVQGASLSEHVEPLRLLLLAEDPSWETLVRKCLLPMGSSVILLCAPNWESVSYLFENDRNALLLTTPTSIKDRKSTRLNSSHNSPSRMPSSA